VATSVVDVDIGNADFGTLATYSCPASPPYRTAFRHAHSPTTRATVGPDTTSAAGRPPAIATNTTQNPLISSRLLPAGSGAPRPSRGFAPKSDRQRHRNVGRALAVVETHDTADRLLTGSPGAWRVGRIAQSLGVGWIAPAPSASAAATPKAVMSSRLPSVGTDGAGRSSQRAAQRPLGRAQELALDLEERRGARRNDGAWWMRAGLGRGLGC
jgi:hypothetical protein